MIPPKLLRRLSVFSPGHPLAKASMCFPVPCFSRFTGFASAADPYCYPVGGSDGKVKAQIAAWRVRWTLEA